MRDTVNHKKTDQGYSLIELAIMLMIVGILSVPAFHIYGLYTENQMMERTETTLSNATSALGGFRSIHGRYPCPASANVARGDINYGYEDCTVSPPGIVSATNSSTQDILIGTLPFRTLGLDEQDAHDGYSNRLTYAITESLTDDATFNMAGGAIDIVDVADNTLITPAESAHFVVLSHNSDSEGAWTKAGVQVTPCASASLSEQENCDGDMTFRKASKRDDFDDRVFYTTSIGLTHWQLSEMNENDIHLIRADNFTVGLDNGLPPLITPTAGMIDIHNYIGFIDEATVKATTGVFHSQMLCDDGGGICFSPTVIYGLHSAGQGMDCDTDDLPGGTDFLVGIENGSPLCEDKITFSCPPGEFFGGMNSDGTLICDTQPLDPCLDDNVTTTCGDTRAITGIYSGGYRYAYSGECYRSPVSEADAKSDFQYIVSAGAGTKTSAAGTTIAQGGGLAEVQAYVNDVNAMARVATDCGSTATNAQVRDTFKCHNGSWGPHTPYNANYASEMAHERLAPNGNFPQPPYDTSPWHPAEVTVAYAPGVDPSNTNASHDCWCREDYSVTTSSCTGGLTGTVLRLNKHRCPQTSHQWNNIDTSGTDLCGCTPGPEGPSYYQKCYQYFGVPTDGTTFSKQSRVSGNVYRERYRKCDGGGNVYYDPNWQYDITDCACHEKTQLTTVACPTGWTNSFIYNSTAYTDVAEIKSKTWQCPTGDGGPVTNTPEGGSWSSWTTAHTESCTCDSSIYEDNFSDCPASLAGPPGAIHERRFWDCIADDWGPWNPVSNACYACVWTPPPGSGNIQATAALEVAGDSCDCTISSPSSCYLPSGGDYEVWTGCQCSP